jgi:hypothetical protein
MSRGERIIRAILRAYPADWRAEYGEELVGLLAVRALTLRDLSNVLFNGFWQRLKNSTPWKVGAVALFIVTVLCLVRNTLEPLSTEEYSGLTWIVSLSAMAVSFWSILLEPANFRGATRAALGSVLIGVLPELIIGLFWAVDLVHPTVLAVHGPPRTLGHGIRLLYVRTDVSIGPMSYLSILLLGSAYQTLFFGWVGALLGRGGLRSRQVLDRGSDQ